MRIQHPFLTIISTCPDYPLQTTQEDIQYGGLPFFNGVINQAFILAVTAVEEVTEDEPAEEDGMIENDEGDYFISVNCSGKKRQIVTVWIS